MICDPCGGSGAFIQEACDALDYTIPSRLYYYDIDRYKAYISAKYCFAGYVHPRTGNVGLSGITTVTQDSLAVDWPQMDVIYTNVPFGLKTSDGAILQKFDTGKKPDGKVKKSELSQLLFIEKCIKQLKPDGRFATVVDKGVVTNESLCRERKIILELAWLEYVVELPATAFKHFAGTTFPTYLLFFRKTTPPDGAVTKFATTIVVSYEL